MVFSSPKRATRLATPTVILYASGYPIGAAAVAVMSPLLVITLRFALSAMILWSIVSLRSKQHPSKTQILHAIVSGVLTQGVQFIALYWALAQGVGSGLAALVIALNPVMTSMLLATFSSHRETPRGVAALVLGAVAVALSCAPKIMADPSIGLPLIAVVIAMLGLSTGGIYQQRYCADMDPTVLTAIGVTASLPLAAIALLFTPINVTNWAASAVLLLVMVLFNSVGATTLYAACIAQFGARAASVLFAVIPSVAGLLAWLFLGETLSIFTMSGFALGAAACLLQFSAKEPTSKPLNEHPLKP